MIIGIYKITSPSGKIYVGQSIDIKRRFNKYKNKQCSSQPKLYNSLVKHGPENHIFEIIEECSVDLLNEREMYWKQQHDSVLTGLNCGLFDRGGGPKSEETKQKMRKPKPKGFGDNHSYKMKGKKFSEEHRLKLSNIRKNIKPSEETKQKMRKPKINTINSFGKKNHINKKNYTFFNIITEEKFIGLASEFYKEKKENPSGINNLVKNKYKKYNNWIILNNNEI